VRVDSLNRRAAVCGWRSQEVDNGRLVFGDHGHRSGMSIPVVDAGGSSTSLESHVSGRHGGGASKS
jgi:hypothetical protein